MKRMLTLAMAVLCIALYPVSAQKSEVNENDKYYKAREIIDAKGDLNKAAELLRDNVKEYPNGCIMLEPRELVVPETISVKTLKDMDSAIRNFRNGVVSPEIDLSDF